MHTGKGRGRGTRGIALKGGRQTVLEGRQSCIIMLESRTCMRYVGNHSQAVSMEIFMRVEMGKLSPFVVVGA